MGNIHRRKKKERDRGRRMAEAAWGAVERGDLARAEETIRAALKGREGDCTLWNDLGLVLWKRDDLREAEKAFRDALNVEPLYDEAKMNLASLLAARGFYRQALRLEEELAASDSPRVEFHRKRVDELRAAAEERSRVTEEESDEAREADAGLP